MIQPSEMSFVDVMQPEPSKKENPMKFRCVDETSFAYDIMETRELRFRKENCWTGSRIA